VQTILLMARPAVRAPSPATMLATRFPYRLGVTMTSNWCGLLTSCMQVLSTIISVYSMLGYLAATALVAWGTAAAAAAATYTAGRVGVVAAGLWSASRCALN
jgi:hypothetical protein